MQRFKKTDLWLLTVLSLLVAISLALPSQVQIEPSVTINAF